MSPEREALLRATMAMTVDQRVDWLERMMETALESGALPKRVPDQERTSPVGEPFSLGELGARRELQRG
jgi:hypothetical protein